MAVGPEKLLDVRVADGADSCVAVEYMFVPPCLMSIGPGPGELRQILREVLDFAKRCAVRLNT